MSDVTDAVEIRIFRPEDLDAITEAFGPLGKPASQYQRYLEEQQEGHRVVLLAIDHSKLAGYLTIVWSPDYPPFRDQKIPEIQDLNVLPAFRRKGIASHLLEWAESSVAKRSTVVGIGFGLTADYGPAQRLYVRRGYMPDGNGLAYRNRFPVYGDHVMVDDDLVLRLVKSLVQ
jgi:ribosomal protein S18 acetylase RimI-like enzyme